MAALECVNLDVNGLDPAAVRDRPRLPSPAWALVFVALALYDLWQALAWLTAQGPSQATREVVLRIEADIAWGILLGATLVAGYLRLAPRNFARGVIGSVMRVRPRIGLGQRLFGVLVFVVLYGLTFVPVIVPGPEGLAGRALAAVPVDIAVAACLWDLRRYHREAWKVIRHLKGEPASVRMAALDSPQVRALTPDLLLAHPRYRYNLPLLLILVQASLLSVGLSSLASGWSSNGSLCLGVPALAWLFWGWGLVIGLWGTWHESRKLRGQELEMALCAVLKELRSFHMVWWDWWGYLVILTLFGGALWMLALLPEAAMRVAGGALAVGYGLGVTPLHRHYVCPWALAWAIMREVKGPNPGPL